MLSKKELKIIVKCVDGMDCYNCPLIKTPNAAQCISKVSQTALQLLQRVETAEQIFKDILSSRSIKACEGEILKWLEQV